MIVRYLDLVALVRERHFARAAAVCNVTQPTLSTGIKQTRRRWQDQGGRLENFDHASQPGRGPTDRFVSG
jgi:hypothetical protein